ncbi:NADH:ubiquinone oxidoreductase subunit F (NADH-binding)/ferredoxin [Kitasatospora sp. MAA4]|uniref:NADH-quinone oxidoreductase subunit NuoF family protein n=1 Tax=Kitasatospora sp. MAA4 TaxID=3035093 RepID=UPI0024765F0E|nr:NADH-quinone oxidoreductase subunit NuoF family protein [Kitasatospora sp. MAA4]MDH6132221.1 NADH:ubiquinone oxidoreductase subunit F (NADH-binding)/ferredoxin [Kitasatospora sp. MAA4]
MSARIDLPPVRHLGPPRLTTGLDRFQRLDLAAHTRLHPPLPRLTQGTLLDLAERVDLRGRGGAGFPFARKARAAVAAADRTGTRPVVVVNGAEGEPPSAKDRMLLARAPHLVLDGACLAAAAFGAEEIVIGVAAGSPGEVSIPAAIAERDLPCPARTVCLPERFVSGESGALIRGVNGLPVLPAAVKARAAEGGTGGVRRRPTLLSNAETWAQLAVAARLGPEAYAAVGTDSEPGTVLLTVNRPGAEPLVVEAPFGTRLGDVLDTGGLRPGDGVLVGGYHGGWLDPVDAVSASLSRAGLAELGGTLGAGAIVALPAATCPLGEIARVAAWLAGQSAGQCGPCKRGLPDAAESLAALATGAGGPAELEDVQRALGGAQGGGACSHPDGTARFVLSALDVFAGDVEAHVAGTGCGRPVLGVLPLPRDEGPHLEVDWSRCAGHGLCGVLAPGLVRLGPHGYPASTTVPVAPWQEHGAHRAVNQCPALALRMRRPERK